MRGVRGEIRSGNSAIDTINAAATAIATAETRVQPPSFQKRRWNGCWSISWCFGSHKQSKRIGHAVLVPEETSTSNNNTTPTRTNIPQPPAIVVPFVAPPSSPASFLASEPPSTTQSPAGIVSLTSISANMYSPTCPRSIFAVGPYAHETQLVSPPVFSTFTTEPSTAPFTPPPESVHLTTPSSPEVPYAQLLDPKLRTCGVSQKFGAAQYEFQTYQFYPGSPMDQLISPGSAISGSGTSSPFIDQEIPFGGLHFPDFRLGAPPKLLNPYSVRTHEWGSFQQGSGSVTPDALNRAREGFRLDRNDSTVSPLPSVPNGHHSHETAVVDYRVSFELTSEDVVRCVEKGPTALPRAVQAKASLEEIDESPSMVPSGSDQGQMDGEDDVAEKAPMETHVEDEGLKHQKHRSVSLGSVKEFNFDSVANRGDSQKLGVGSNWWANEKVWGKEGETCNKNWSFFPMVQPGVS